LRLQLFVSSTLNVTGIPQTETLPLNELFKKEYPAINELTGLIRKLIMSYDKITVKIRKKSVSEIGYFAAERS